MRCGLLPSEPNCYLALFDFPDAFQNPSFPLLVRDSDVFQERQHLFSFPFGLQGEELVEASLRLNG